MLIFGAFSFHLNQRAPFKQNLLEIIIPLLPAPLGFVRTSCHARN